MNYLVDVDHNIMAALLTGSDCERVSRCAVYAVGGTDGDMLWNGNVENGNGGRECEEDEGTDCEDGGSGTDWLRWIECDMLCVLSVYG
jgi:hypothetical protein